MSSIFHNICPSCQGTGKRSFPGYPTPTQLPIDCPTCQGRGYIYTNKVPLPDEIFDSRERSHVSKTDRSLNHISNGNHK